MRKLATAAVAGTLLFMLTGCYKFDVNYAFQEDGTVSGTMIVGMSKEASKQMGDFGGEGTEESLVEPGEYPEGSKIEEWSDDKYEGQKITFENAEVSELTEEGDDSMSVQLKDGKYFVELSDMGGDMTEGTDMAEMEQFFKMFGEPEVSFILEFPGEITKHEGVGAVEGNRLVLNMDDVLAADRIYLEADAKPSVVDKLANALDPDASDNSSATLLIVGGVLLVLLVGGGAALMVVRKRTPAAEAPAKASDPADPVE